jgi:myo-inositol 2-dehydrogenase / D-chiro-inositol 1-dehydrogenase
MAMTTRVGFIGSGSVANRHAVTLRKFDDVEVVAVVSERPPRAEEFADRFDAEAYESPEQLLVEARCDVVYVCVPPDQHGDIEELIIDAGLPFFVEKPLANDLATAERIAAALEKKPVATATGYHWRYSGSVEEAKNLLAKHRPLLATAQWWDRTPQPEWWRDPARSGGQVIEQATHLLDTLRFLIGEAEVHGTTNGPPAQGDHGVDRAVVSALRFHSGVVGSLTCTPMYEPHKHVAIDVVCKDMWLRVRENRLERLDGDAPELLLQQDEQEPRRLVDRHFIGTLRGDPDTEVRANYAEALKTHRLACAVASAAQARPSRLQELPE